MARGSRREGTEGRRDEAAGRDRANDGAQGTPAALAEAKRLELLHRLSALLVRSEAVKRDVSAVLALLGEELPLRTAVLVLDGSEPPRASLWHAEGVSAARREAALTHARRTYAQLGRQTLAGADTGATGVLTGTAAPTAGETEPGFVMLPLVVAGRPIFGALQIEATVARLSELDLTLIDTVVQQLAIALDRQRAIEAHREAAEQRRVEAERGRTKAVALQRRYEALVDNLHRAFVWELGVPGRDLRYVSARAAELLGFRGSYQLLDRIHEDDREAVERTLADVLSEQKDRSVEHRMVAEDGTIRWFHTGVHLADADDGGARWQGVSIDVTAGHDAAARIAAQLDFTRAVTASLGEGVLAVDRDLRLTFANPVAETMLGVTDEALGRPVDDILPITRVDGSRLPSPLARVIRDGKRLRSDARFFAPRDAPPVPVSYTAAPLRMAGEVTGAVLVFRDLLEVRRAEREQRFLAETGELLSSSLEVRTTLSQLVHRAVPLLADLCIVDEQGEDSGVARLEVAFADPDQQALADRARRFIPTPDGSTPQSRVLRTGRAILVPQVVAPDVSADEAHAQLLEEIGLSSMLVVPLVARGRILGALTFGAIGPSRRYGERDLAFAEDVGRRAALAVDNARLYEQAQRATEARQELLAVVSHDLRNPLSSVLMATQILLEDTTLSPAEVRLAVERIRRASERANRLVEDLLDIGNIESGVFQVQPSTRALTPLLEEAIEQNHPAARRAGVHLELEPAPAVRVRCDRERILQVLTNLIGNAIKFTPREGRVSVRAARRDWEALVSVSDTGAGIAEEALPHVFDRYWQIQRTARAGAGLGLAIVQGLVRAHGGNVWVESEIGKGSTFHFTLPLA